MRKGSSPLDHPTRREMLKIIREHPAINQKELVERLNIHSKTLQHHERKLLAAGLIKRGLIGKTVHYWDPSEGTLNTTHLLSLILNDPTKNKVIDVFLRQPGISITRAADLLQRNPGTVSRHVKQLVDLKILKIKAKTGNRLEIGVDPAIENDVKSFFEARKRHPSDDSGDS